VLSWGKRPVLVYLNRDLDGKEYADTAYTPYDPPPAIRQTNQVLHIRHNEVVFSRSLARAYGNTINGGAWLDYPKYAVLADTPTATQHWHDEDGTRESYWQVLYEFEIACGWYWHGGKRHKRLWHPHRVANIGPMAFPEDKGGQPAQVVDSWGSPTSVHQKLDEDGYQAEPGDDTIYNEFRQYHVANFSTWLDWL